MGKELGFEKNICLGNGIRTPLHVQVHRILIIAASVLIGTLMYLFGSKQIWTSNHYLHENTSPLRICSTQLFLSEAQAAKRELRGERRGRVWTKS